MTRTRRGVRNDRTIAGEDSLAIRHTLDKLLILPLVE